MKERPDLLSADSPEGLQVFQLTNESLPSCHIYMEAQIFTPDSKAFLLHRSAVPHGSNSDDPEHRYLLCDVQTGGLEPVTDEIGATSPSVSPDGRYIYYFVTRGGQYSTRFRERITLRRREIRGGPPVDLLVVDGTLPGTPFRPSRLYPLSTISADGKRLAISCYLGDGAHRGGPWGLWVINLESGESWLPVIGPTWSNMHPQYCRSRLPDRVHDLMIQENHGAITASDGGKAGGTPRGLGADIHLIRDDGQHFRNLPWGRIPGEAAQGHQCWRGETDWAITSTNTLLSGGKREGWLLESQAVPFDDHGGATSGGRRHRFCIGENGHFYSHFATDRAGRRLISDGMKNHNAFLQDPGTNADDFLALMTLGEPGCEPVQSKQFLLKPRATWREGAHPHPFLSPDGKVAFFNSDESGVMQAYMIKNLSEVN